MKISPRSLSACVCSGLALWIPGVAAGAVYIAGFEYHGRSLSYDYKAIPFLIWYGAVLMFPPSALFAATLTPIAASRRRRHRPGGTLYVIAAALSAVLFIGLTCLFAKPLPESVMNFNPDVAAIRRPLIGLSEAPLLAISVLAGLLSARVCDKVLRIETDRSNPANALIRIVESHDSLDQNPE